MDTTPWVKSGVCEAMEMNSRNPFAMRRSKFPRRNQWRKTQRTRHQWGRSEAVVCSDRRQCVRRYRTVCMPFLSSDGRSYCILWTSRLQSFCSLLFAFSDHCERWVIDRPVPCWRCCDGRWTHSTAQFGRRSHYGCWPFLKARIQFQFKFASRASQNHSKNSNTLQYVNVSRF